MADLITLQEYKNYMGINGPTQDTEIGATIPKVSQLVKNYCRRTFVDYVDEDKVERFSGGEFFLLSEFPVTQIVDVETSDDCGKTYVSMVEYETWAFDHEHETVVPIETDYFAKKVNGYRVTYRGGYEVVPEDLKLAVLDLVTYYMKHEAAIHNTSILSGNSAQVQYITNPNFPTNIKRVLDLYVGNYN